MLFRVVMAGLIGMLGVSLLLGGTAPTWAAERDTVMVRSFSNLSLDADRHVEKFSAEEVKQILVDEGYGSVRVLSEKQVVFKALGRTMLLSVYPDGDLQLYYGGRGATVTLEDINEWNHTKRMSRAYIDKDGDVVLESDLMANGGLTENRVEAFLKMFVNVSVPAYVRFIQERNQG